MTFLYESGVLTGPHLHPFFVQFLLLERIFLHYSPPNCFLKAARDLKHRSLQKWLTKTLRFKGELSAGEMNARWFPLEAIKMHVWNPCFI